MAWRQRLLALDRLQRFAVPYCAHSMYTKQSTLLARPERSSVLLRSETLGTLRIEWDACYGEMQ